MIDRRGPPATGWFLGYSVTVQGEGAEEMSYSRYRCMLFIEMGSAVHVVPTYEGLRWQGGCYDETTFLLDIRLDTLRICDSISMPPLNPLLRSGYTDLILTRLTAWVK